MFDLYREQNAWQMLHTEGNQVLNAKCEKVRLMGDADITVKHRYRMNGRNGK